MKHFTDPEFWPHYRKLPADIRKVADKKFGLLRVNPRHPSVQLKKIGVLYSARIGSRYRALARERPDGLQWFWIGHHSIYDRLLSLR